MDIVVGHKINQLPTRGLLMLKGASGLNKIYRLNVFSLKIMVFIKQIRYPAFTFFIKLLQLLKYLLQANYLLKRS